MRTWMGSPKIPKADSPQRHRSTGSRQAGHTEEDLNLGEGAVPVKTVFFTTEINEDTEKTREIGKGVGPVKTLNS